MCLLNVKFASVLIVFVWLVAFHLQLSIDYAKQGVNTLWGSFEIKNTRLIKKMLCQYAGKDLSNPNHLHMYPVVADQFSQLPLYFLRFFGATDVDQVRNRSSSV